MNVGVCRIKLYFPQNRSLKEKRRIVKSVVARIRNNFNVSIAEVKDQDLWQVATLGITCVASDGRQTNGTLSQVLNFIISNYPEIELIDHETELLPLF